MTQAPAVHELIADMEAAGIRLWEDDGSLRFRAPKGALTEERRAALVGAKPEIIAHLRRESEAETVRPEPERRLDPFPLTDVQQAYLIGRNDAFGYGGVACHGYVEVSFPRLDPERVQAAWRALIGRHDMLRAVIHPDGHQQVLAEVPGYEVSVTDLRGTDPEERLAAVREEMANTVYPAGSWPLFELRISLTDRGALLHASIDLLIADYVSIQLLLGELHLLHENPDADLPPVPVSFRDCLLALRAQRESARYDRDRAYWWGRMDDLPPAPELPALDQAAADARFRRWESRVEPAQWARLRTRAAAAGITPSQAVLAAYAEVIGRWSRRPRFTLNLTLLDRPPLHPYIDRVVGDFTTLNLLAVDTAPGRSFAERAHAIGRQLFADMEHRRCGGIEVMRELARRRGRDAALMPVVFTSAIGLGRDDAEHGTPEYGISQTPQVWIDCQVKEHRDALLVNWDVRAGVFPEGLVDDMFAAFTALLHDLSSDETWSSASPVELPGRRPEAAPSSTPPPRRSRTGCCTRRSWPRHGARRNGPPSSRAPARSRTASCWTGPPGWRGRCTRRGTGPARSSPWSWTRGSSRSWPCSARCWPAAPTCRSTPGSHRPGATASSPTPRSAWCSRSPGTPRTTGSPSTPSRRPVPGTAVFGGALTTWPTSSTPRARRACPKA